MDDRHLGDIFELYLLGALDAGEHEEITQHMGQGCPMCEEAMRDAAESVYVLAQGIAPLAPPSGLKSRLMERIGAAPARVRQSKAAPLTPVASATDAPARRARVSTPPAH